MTDGQEWKRLNIYETRGSLQFQIAITRFKGEGIRNTNCFQLAHSSVKVLGSHCNKLNRLYPLNYAVRHRGRENQGIKRLFYGYRCRSVINNKERVRPEDWLVLGVQVI